LCNARWMLLWCYL